MPEKYASKNHIERIKKEVNRLYKENDDIRVLREGQKSFDAIKSRHQNTLDELKGRLEESETDKAKMRERLQAAIEKEKVFAVSKFSKDVLEIIDNLDRAIKYATEADKESNLYQGVELTLNQALHVLARFDIQQLEDPVGAKFDPNFHEVVFENTNPSLESGTIINVLQKGYTIKDRLLRPFTVGVSRKD
jgi:molecular chaperone GrpE